MRALLLALVVALCLPLPAAAAPAVTGIAFNGYTLTWDAVAGVDGYRVYAADNRTCCSYTVVYDGTAPEFVDLALTLKIFRIVTYIGVDEGPPSPPIYLFRVALPYALASSNTTPVSVPYVNTFPDSHELCIAANLNNTGRVAATKRFNHRVDTITAQICAVPDNRFQVLPGRAYGYSPETSNVDVWVWGISDGLWAIDLEADTPGRTMRQAVSLPYDHAYRDLADLAADVPSATAVLAWNISSGLLGLTRSDPTQPWIGTNVSLTNHLGEGVFIGVETAVTWSPRQYCTGPVHVVAQCPGNNTVGCDVDCTPAACGDGYTNPAAGEQCDDGNLTDGDGCSAQCQICITGNLTRIYPLLATNGAAPAVNLSWPYDPTTPVGYHLNFAAHKSSLQDPRTQPTGSGTRECTTAAITTTCTDSDPDMTTGIVYYQVMSTCGPNPVNEGPY